MFGAAMPFAAKALNANWAELVAKVPADLLPRETPPASSRHRTRGFVEYGCGFYGCVLPTGRPRVVLKVTTDPSEVQFVTLAMQLGSWPPGIVRYYEILPLQGSYRGRPIVCIWREEAENVGAWLPDRYGRLPRPVPDDPTLIQYDQPSGLSEYDVRARREAAKRLAQFKLHARYVRETLKRAGPRAGEMLLQAKQLEQWAWNNIGLDDLEQGAPEFDAPSGSAMLRGQRGAYAVAARLRACAIVAELMANEPEGYLIGQTFEFYLEHGLLLADVHAGNVGEVVREEYGEKPVLVICDPGHAVVLR